MARSPIVGLLAVGAVLALASCGGGGSTGSSSPATPPNPPPTGTADPPLIDFTRFGLRDPAAVTLVAFESGGQLAQAAVELIARAETVTRFPASISCQAGSIETATNAADLDLIDVDQNGRVGPGDGLNVTLRECRLAAFGAAHLTGRLDTAPQTPAAYSGPDPAEQILDVLVRATALTARWGATAELTYDGRVAARHLAGRAFRMTGWTTNDQPLRIRGRRDLFRYDLGLRSSRASQYHDYREARTNLTLDGEVLEYALSGGFRLTASTPLVSYRLNQVPQAGRIVLSGAGVYRAALVAGFNELVLESDRDGDGSFESRYQDPQSWTLGSTGFLFWDPFTARPSTDAYAIGMNPNNVLERLAAIPDLSTGTPLVSPEQRFRTYWSKRIDAGTTGPVRFIDASFASPDVAATVTFDGAILEFAPSVPLRRGGVYEVRTTGPLAPEMTGAMVLARVQVEP